MQYPYSSILISLLAVLGGLALLISGGELLVSGSVKLANRLKMNPLIIGLTVVAFGTSTPELFVGITASAQDLPEIMLGNVIGSNIANIGLILAISALISPLAIHYQRLRLELWSVLVVSLLTVGLAWYGSMPRLAGVAFCALLALYTIYSYKNPQHKTSSEEAEETGSSLTVISLSCLGGLLFLALGSDFFIAGAVDMALYFKVPALIIGLTMAAVGTSLPELASCVSAIRRNEPDLLLGNIIGSNLFNLLMVMGGTALIFPFAFPADLLHRDLPVMILFALLLIPLLRLQHKISRFHGLIILLLYGAYIYSLI